MPAAFSWWPVRFIFRMAVDLDWIFGRVEIGIDIAALHGGGADLVRLEVLPQDGHGQRGLDVGIKKVDIDGGVVRLGVGVDAEMAVFAEAGDGDLSFILVVEGIVKLDAEALGGGIDERMSRSAESMTPSRHR